MTIDMKSTGLENASIGLALAVAGGLSTAVGAGMVFSEKYIKLASQRVLAGGLGVSAGVMIYVSFVEIFHESVERFGQVQSGVVGENGEPEVLSEKFAEFLAGLTFFGGMLLMLVLDKIVHMIDPDHDTPHVHEEGQVEEKEMSIIVDINDTPKSNKNSKKSKRSSKVEKQHQQEMPNAEGNLLMQNAKELRLMGLKTAIAIALHNFPEGVATFVATLNSVQLGLTMCLGIAIHNIPEGFCVAVPYYYATGNRWKAFLWGTLSGLTEPLGALLCWAVCYLFSVGGSIGESGEDIQVDIPPLLYGILFGLVSGMMVFLSISELLPTAFKYAGDDGSLVAKCTALGMAIMWASMLLE